MKEEAERTDLVKREMEMARLRKEEELGIIAIFPPMNFNAKSLSFLPASIRNSCKQGSGLQSHAAVCFLFRGGGGDGLLGCRMCV